jgi:hypothetical protein
MESKLGTYFEVKRGDTVNIAAFTVKDLAKPSWVRPKRTWIISRARWQTI